MFSLPLSPNLEIKAEINEILGLFGNWIKMFLSMYLALRLAEMANYGVK